MRGESHTTGEKSGPTTYRGLRSTGVQLYDAGLLFYLPCLFILVTLYYILGAELECAMHISIYLPDVL